MVDIRPLTPDCLEAVVKLIVGYATTEIYVVTKQETAVSTTLSLQLHPLEQPRIVRYTVTEEMIATYRCVLEEGTSLGAFVGPELVGFALAEAHAWNRAFWVWEFHVAATYQGQGIGRALMERLVLAGQQAGMRTIVCETQNTNVPAIRFYRALGFAVEGIDVSYYTNEDMEPGGEVAVFMKRRLE